MQPSQQSRRDSLGRVPELTRNLVQSVLLQPAAQSTGSDSEAGINDAVQAILDSNFELAMKILGSRMQPTITDEFSLVEKIKKSRTYRRSLALRHLLNSLYRV
jgi:hypothetical protein